MISRMGRPEDYPMTNVSEYGYNGQRHFVHRSGKWEEIDPKDIPTDRLPSNSPYRKESIISSGRRIENTSLTLESKPLLPAGVKAMAANRLEEKLAMGRITK